MAEILKSLERMGPLKPNLWEHADGGGEHHTAHPSVIVAALNFWIATRDRLDRLIKTRGCPYLSYIHEVEKIMCILNLALYNVAMKRPRISQDEFPGMEHRFRSCKGYTELRAYGARYPQMVTGLHKAVEPMLDLLSQRFERLKLKGVPFLRGVQVWLHCAASTHAASTRASPRVPPPRVLHAHLNLLELA